MFKLTKKYVLNQKLFDAVKPSQLTHPAEPFQNFQHL